MILTITVLVIKAVVEEPQIKLGSFLVYSWNQYSERLKKWQSNATVCRERERERELEGKRNRVREKKR